MYPTQEHINTKRVLDIKGEINNTVIIRDFNTPTKSVSSREKIDEETLALNDTLDQRGLIYTEHFIPKLWNTRSFHVHLEFSPRKITCLKFRQTEIVLSIFSDYNSIKLEINKKTGKNTNVENKQHATGQPMN